MFSIEFWSRQLDAFGLKSIVMFGLVGCSGMLLHFPLLYCLLHFANLSFVVSQSIAVALVTAWNFRFHHRWTFRDNPLKVASLKFSFLRFMLVCLAGMAINVTVAQGFYSFYRMWWLASLVGIFAGFFWNYGVSRRPVWT